MTKAKRGRPKCFDEQRALEQAMLLFWQYGYEATSISDLTQVLGITAPSLYCCFGDKAQLFDKSIHYYLEHEACPLPRIFDNATTAKSAVESLLLDHLNRFTRTDKPAGCMLITSIINCTQQSMPLQQKLLQLKHDRHSQLLARLQRGIDEEDLPEDAPIQQMLDFYSTVLQGLTLQARDGMNASQLQSVVHQALQHWEMFLVG